MKLSIHTRWSIVGWSLPLYYLLVGIHLVAQPTPGDYTRELLRLRQVAGDTLLHHITEFNDYPDRPAADGPYDSTNNATLLLNNVPLFLSSDQDFTEVYNYRWWMMSKHLRRWRDPTDDKAYWVVTEFFGYPTHGSRSGAIPCPAGHQFYDLRWFRDPQYLQSYIDFYMRGYAASHDQRNGRNFHSHIQRPESHHFSSWMVDGAEAFLKVHPDAAWRDTLLPYLEDHQRVWDEKFRVTKTGARTDGLYKVLDVYDGMEFTISATLPLIASDGPYTIYDEENWRQYYLGWGAIGGLQGSDLVQAYPEAFAQGYPLLYLVRPSINSYYFANLRSLGKLYGLKAAQSGATAAATKRDAYYGRAEALREKALSVLWNDGDQFFYSYTAADNAYGVKDVPSRIRESVGYTPWYFNMIPERETRYDTAWAMLFSSKGFAHTKGMTTAERQHPLYDERAYAWNGRGWPFQNSVVNKAYVNYLRNYKDTITPQDRSRLYTLIHQLVLLHGTERNIGEWYLPSSSETFGGVRDYFHSTFPDMLIEDLLGFTASHDEVFTLHPLLPEDKWDYFYLGNLSYHGRTIDIVWKTDWDTHTAGNQSKLCIWVDDQLVHTGEKLDEVVTINLE